MRSLAIALKDTLLQFRDMRALLLMLAAPLLIALIMGAAFGGQNDGSSPIAHIPVAVVNADDGDLGQVFVDVLTEIQVETSAGQQALFDVSLMAAEDEARASVERGAVSGALYLPPRFSAALQNADTQATVQIYTDPTSSVSPAILHSVAQRIVQGFQTVALGSQLAAQLSRQAVQDNPALASAMAELPAAIAAAQQSFAARAKDNPSERIRLHSQTLGAAQSFNIMGYFMPSMTIFFLLFAMFASTRSILEEEARGTLARLMTTPARPYEILLGKIGGALIGGILQMTLLALVSSLFFGVAWGDPLGVALMTLSTVAAAGGLGALITALARDASQSNLIGTLVTLVFSVLGGNFIVMERIPAWFDVLSQLTLNRWALDGFVALSVHGRTWTSILPNAAVLCAIAAASFALALPRFNRRFMR